MKVRYRIYFGFIVLIALMIGVGATAHAQRSKKRKELKEAAKAGMKVEAGLQEEDSKPDKEEAEPEEGKKKKKKKKQYSESNGSARKPVAVSEKVAQPKPLGGRRKQEIYYPDTKKKKRYRISVIMPLYLDELVRGESVTFKEKVPDKAAPGLAFYQGLKMAADSLRKTGAKLDIHIHDAGSFSESPEMLINNRKLDSTDLIIGAVEQHDIPVLATYAKKKKINFVSALTNYDGWVKDNQYFTMLQPSVKSHCEYIIDDLSAKYAGQNVVLLYRTSSLADDNAALYILNDLYSEVTFRKLLCNSLPGKDALTAVFDTSRPNIVVVSILDPVFADSILRGLSGNFPNTHFEVYGMPGWNAMPHLRKANGYKNLTVNVTYPFNFETADSSLLLSLKLKYNKEFGGVPSEMVWRGYETMLWYGSLLKEYGTIFNSDYSDISAAPFTKFKIKPRWDRNGSLLYLENKHIYMSAYQGGVYRTTNTK